MNVVISSLNLFKANKAKIILFDQILVSASNFIIGLFLVRALGVYEFGIYSLMWMVVIILNSLQVSIVIAPMMSLISFKENGDNKRKFQQYTQLQCFVGAISSVITFIVMCVGCYIKNIDYDFVLIFMCSLSMLFYQWQDYIRRTFFCCYEYERAFLSDSITYISKLVLLILLYIYSSVSIISVFIVTFISAILGILVSYKYVYFGKFSKEEFNLFFYENWNFSKWLSLSTVIKTISGELPLLIVGFLLGPYSAGIMKAAQSVVGISHILFQALENYFPRVAKKCVEFYSYDELKKIVKKANLVGSIVTAIICLFLFFFSEFIFRKLFGDEFSKHHLVLIAYLPSYLLTFSTLIYRIGLRTILDTRSIFISQIISSLSLLVIIYPLTNYFGIYGALLSSAFSSLVQVTILMVKFYSHNIKS